MPKTPPFLKLVQTVSTTDVAAWEEQFNDYGKAIGRTFTEPIPAYNVELPRHQAIMTLLQSGERVVPSERDLPLTTRPHDPEAFSQMSLSTLLEEELLKNSGLDPVYFNAEERRNLLRLPSQKRTMKAVGLFTKKVKNTDDISVPKERKLETTKIIQRPKNPALLAAAQLEAATQTPLNGMPQVVGNTGPFTSISLGYEKAPEKSFWRLANETLGMGMAIFVLYVGIMLVTGHGVKVALVLRFMANWWAAVTIPVSMMVVGGIGLALISPIAHIVRWIAGKTGGNSAKRFLLQTGVAIGFGLGLYQGLAWSASSAMLGQISVAYQKSAQCDNYEKICTADERLKAQAEGLLEKIGCGRKLGWYPRWGRGQDEEKFTATTYVLPTCIP